jgi:hypothetical protein
MKFGAIAFGLAVGVMSVLPSQVFAYTGEKLAKGAKVSIDEARAIALKAQPGTISDQRSSLLLRHPEQRRNVRSRSGCADWQGCRKQEGGTSPRLGPSPVIKCRGAFRKPGGHNKKRKPGLLT